MKKFLIAIVIVTLVLVAKGKSEAITIGFDPQAQTVDLGSTVSIDLTISGLGDGIADSLSEFDLDVAFDSTILGFTSATYGDPILGDQLDLFGFGSLQTTTPGIGSVSLFELSFDFASDLNDLQASNFVLATLNFNTLSAGISSLGLSINTLGDAWGSSLSANTESGTIEVVHPVPEPGTFVLLGFGLIGLITLRRKKSICFK